MNDSLTYNVNARPEILAHASLPTWLLREAGDTGSPEQVAAMVASGDCFLTLATIAEKIADSLTVDAAQAGPELDQLAQILFYMQRSYSITPKLPPQYYDK